MINLTNLSMAYGARLLFDEVNLNLLPGNRYGLIGANGAGKSTFLKLLAGEEEPSLGEITIQRNAVIGWLKQDLATYEDDTILNAVLRGKPELWQALVEKEQLMQADVWNDVTGMRLGELEETIMHYDGYTAENFAAELLEGLGIPADKHLKPLSTLSGGYKLRVLLAQSLFNQPDILLLDEPTNHLDIHSIAWLESYLINQFSGLLVFISHDQDFLNTLSTHILDIDYGDILPYTGNYDKFLQQKTAKSEQMLSEKRSVEKKLEKMQTFVDRFKAKATKARQAMSRMKMMEKIEIPEIKATSRVAPGFAFHQERPSGKTVLRVEGITKAFKDKQVLKNVSFELRRGEKIALIGPNGVGKSTLLKILMERQEADGGTFEWGHAVKASYFAQDHHEDLTGNQNLYNWLQDATPDAPNTAVRSMLGQVLFSKDEVEKNIQSLSGGEAARLLLARVMIEKGNLLILDEPTNHMDLEAVEALIKALKAYPGSVLLVSHNRHIVSKVATRVIALTTRGLRDHLGSYEAYLKEEGIDYLQRH
jgi:ATPase subunit of ABC transporter with duplicated ATPase domains